MSARKSYVSLLCLTLCVSVLGGCASSKTTAATSAVDQAEVNAQQQGPYVERAAAKAMMKRLAAQGLDIDDVRSTLAQAKRQDSILEAMSRPAEKRLTWGQYRKIFIQPKRIQRGVAFWQENREALEQASRQFQVPPEIIVAIIGVETHYGRITGNYRVLDALATLGFDYPKRSPFFLKELEQYFLLTNEEGIDPTSLKGSYAGAMGYGQFMPSSFRAYAVDFDRDGHRNIWTDRTDAIGSVANYFTSHGWIPGGEVISNVVLEKTPDEQWVNAGLKPKVTLAEWARRGVNTHDGLNPQQKATLMKLTAEDGDHYWLGLHNFYVITRYNHSPLYAMAVYELSQDIKKSYERQAK